MLFIVQIAFHRIPRTINEQEMQGDAGGTLLSGGNYEMRFR